MSPTQYRFEVIRDVLQLLEDMPDGVVTIRIIRKGSLYEFGALTEVPIDRRTGPASRATALRKAWDVSEPPKEQGVEMSKEIDNRRKDGKCRDCADIGDMARLSKWGLCPSCEEWDAHVCRMGYDNGGDKTPQQEHIDAYRDAVHRGEFDSALGPNRYNPGS